LNDGGEDPSGPDSLEERDRKEDNDDDKGAVHDGPEDDGSEQTEAEENAHLNGGEEHDPAPPRARSRRGGHQAAA
jgi:hypothetical protein